MSTDSLILMLTVQGLTIGFTAYFFKKIMTASRNNKKGIDSATDYK